MLEFLLKFSGLKSSFEISFKWVYKGCFMRKFDICYVLIFVCILFVFFMNYNIVVKLVCKFCVIGW